MPQTAKTNASAHNIVDRHTINWPGRSRTGQRSHIIKYSSKFIYTDTNILTRIHVPWKHGDTNIIDNSMVRKQCNN